MAHSLSGWLRAVHRQDQFQNGQPGDVPSGRSAFPHPAPDAGTPGARTAAGRRIFSALGRLTGPGTGFA